MKKIFYLIFIVLTLFNCKKEIEINFINSKPDIIINCLFNANKYFNIQVTQSILYTDTNIAYVDNAEVRIKAIKKGEEYILKNNGKGYYYDTTLYPQYNETYTLEVIVPGYEPISATDSLPYPPQAEVLDFFTTNREYEEVMMGYFYNDLIIRLKDSVSYNNYYSLFAWEYWNSDSTYCGTALVSDEFFIKNEGDRNFYLGRVLFSDELIDGKDFTFKVSALAATLKNDTTGHIVLYIMSISKNFYKYIKTYIRHNSASYADFFEMAEPVPMFTNIKNGYGIFAGYSYLKYKCYPTNLNQKGIFLIK